MSTHLFARVTKNLAGILSAVVLVVIAASAAACGESALRAANPVAPSQLVPESESASAVSAGASAAKTTDVSRSFSDEDSDSEDSEDTDKGRAPANNAEVEVEGVVGGLRGSCPDLTFTAGGRTVKVGRGTAFRNGSCNDLRAGGRVKVSGRRAADGSIEATRVELDNTATTVEVEGEIRTVTGSCPSVTLTIGNGTIKTTRDTSFRNGACSDLRVGARAKVTGRRATDASIEATRIELDNTVEVEGEIRTMTGSCPSVTLTIGNGVVKTTRDTSFRNGACGDLRVGARVEIVGRRATDGSIDATRIEFDNTVEVEGEIRTVTGSCPSVTLTIGAGIVKTTRDTSFRNGSCSDLRVGVRVEAAGRRGTDGSIEASRVEIGRLVSSEVELGGVITITSSGCPAGSFTLRVGSESLVLRTVATTEFRNGQCSDLRRGRRLEVKGRRGTDATIEATRIEFRR